MPAGCEFVCKNDKCEQFKNGFSITSPWPMGRIELVINSKKVKNNNDLREYLIKMKNNGEKLACIQLPDDDDIPVVAYKVSFWSKDAKCIYSYPVETTSLDNFEEALEKANLPTKCEKTGCELRGFDDLTKKGMECPYCNEKLTQNRWFTNAK